MRKLVPLAIIAILLTAVPAFAQTDEPTADPTAEVTAEPTLPAPEAPSEPLEPVAGVEVNTVWPIAAFASLLIIGAIAAIKERNATRLLERYIEALERKDVKDLGEQRYIQGSISFQDLIVLSKAGFTFAGNLNLPLVDGAVDATRDYLDAITDGKENA
jgi:hypothetical protein